MVDDSMVFPVEFLRKQFFGKRHAHSRGDTLTERTGSDVDPCGSFNFGVSRSFRVELAEIFNVVHAQIIACQVQKAVKKH